jgi:hypothetical protein
VDACGGSARRPAICAFLTWGGTWCGRYGNSLLFERDAPEEQRFYFVHSYYVECEEPRMWPA